MLHFSAVCDRPAHFRALTGLPVHQFMLLAHRFDRVFLRGMQTETLDGYQREGRAYATYANCPLPMPEDKLLFLLTYLKQNTTQAVQGELFGMTQSNVSKWYHILAAVLDKTLHSQHLLPARNCEELLHILKRERTAAPAADEVSSSDDNAVEASLSGDVTVEANETLPFFIMMALSVP